MRFYSTAQFSGFKIIFHDDRDSHKNELKINTHKKTAKNTQPHDKW